MAKNVAGSDAGIGRAVFTTRLQLSLQAFRMCFWFGMLPGLLLPLCIWLTAVSAQDWDVVKLSVVAQMTGSSSYSEWKIRDAQGVRRTVLAVTRDGRSYASLTPAQVRQALQSRWGAVRRFQQVLQLGLAAGTLGFALAWVWIRRIGSRSQESQRLRGAESLIEGDALSKLVVAGEPQGSALYRLVDVALPRIAPMAGILVQGAQGTGKSLAIHDLMQQVFARRKKCIIYDQSGEFYRAYFRPGKDVFFNPALSGSVPWSIFSEMQYVYDADTLAQAFLPPKDGVTHGPNAFFEDAARALFSVILLRLAEHGAQNTSDIAKAFFEMPDDEMQSLIEKSVASSAVGGDSKAQRQGVISSIAIYLNGIAAVEQGSWSTRDFLEREDDARLFVLGTADTRAMFAPLFRLMLAVCFAVIESTQELVHGDRYWFFLDESHTLGDIKLDEKLATLRKFGVAVVSGIQSESQYFSSMGTERGETVMNCFNTVLMLRMNEPNMMERAAKRLGKQDMELVSQNQALAVTEWRDAAGMTRTQQERWLVMPSDIGSLGVCEGFLKLAGNYPAARVCYQGWIQDSWLRRGRAHTFRPVREAPQRNPRFALQRAHAAGSVDPLEMVAKAAQEAKHAKDAKDAEDVMRATEGLPDNPVAAAPRTSRPSAAEGIQSVAELQPGALSAKPESLNKELF